MEDFLTRIIEIKKRRVADESLRRPLAELRAQAFDVRATAKQHAFHAALADAARVNIIAEFKRASPSKGEIRAGITPEEMARAYERGGAAAISVLTEEDHFRGALADLRAVCCSVALPVLRKDFIFDEFQIYEAAEAGAAALLLIAAALDDETLARLRRLTEEKLGMDALVEVHTAAEMRRAARSGARIIGVNNRDLRTFQVSLDVSTELAPFAPSDARLVSESGINTSADTRRLRACGYSGFLVGETLMRAAQPAETLRALLE